MLIGELGERLGFIIYNTLTNTYRFEEIVNPANTPYESNSNLPSHSPGDSIVPRSTPIPSTTATCYR